MKLMVVAHPDDETIFGGYMLEQSVDWTVLCITNGYKPHRKYEFQEAMKIAKAKGVIWNYLDKLNVPLDTDIEIALSSFIHNGGFTQFVSHGEDGEYRNMHHKQIHQWMTNIVGSSLETFDLSKMKVTDMAQAYLSQIELYKWLILL